MTPQLAPARPLEDGGVAVQTRLLPADLDSVGRRFAAGQSQMREATRALASALGAAAGMAGGDEPGRAFADVHDPAARSVLAALAAVDLGLGGIADGLVTSARNLARADGQPSATPSGTSPTPGPPIVPSAAGGAVGGGFVLPGKLAEFWPAGDPDRLRAAATAWQDAGQAVFDQAGSLHAALRGLVDAGTGPALDRIEAFWGRFRPLLDAAENGASTLARACTGYAQHIDDVRRELVEIGLEVVAITAAGLLLTEFTLGASDVAAAAGVAALVARATQELGHLAEFAHLATIPLTYTPGELDAAVAAAPQVVVTPADAVGLTREVGDALAAGDGARAGFASVVKTAGPVPMTIDDVQIQKKYKHAVDFGVTLPTGKNGYATFRAAVRDFVFDPATTHINGTYHQDNVIINYAPSSHRVVLQKPDGTFISGWKLNPDQEWNVQNRGSL
jgi:Colicin D